VGGYGTGNLEFVAIQSICVDADDQVHVVDWGEDAGAGYEAHRIALFDSNGDYLSEWMRQAFMVNQRFT